MHFLKINHHYTLLWLATLLLLVTSIAPTAAQHTVLTVTVSDSGHVSWNTVSGVTRYKVGYFIGCKGPRVEWEDSTITSFQMPNYDSSLHLYFWVKAFGEVDGREKLLAEGSGRNNGECWIPPEPESPIETGNTATQNISVSFTLDVTRGFVYWRYPTTMSIFEISYSRCGGPWVSNIVTLLAGYGSDEGNTQYQIPDYDMNVRYEFRVRGLNEQYTVLGEGFANNGLECSTSPPTLPENTAPSGPVIAPISVLLNNQTGQVSWGPLNDTTRFMVTYSACQGSRVTNQVSTSLSFQIPGYQSTVRYDVRVDAFEGANDLVGYGVTSNNIACASPHPQDSLFETPSSNAPGTFTLVEQNMTIAPHAGSSLVVNVSSGHINAADRSRGASLSAPGRCTAGQTIASSDSLVISCTSDGHFKVLQVHPQHPADKRRDLVVFNSSLTYCYRAYEYTETGAIEVFYSLCGDN